MSIEMTYFMICTAVAGLTFVLAAFWYALPVLTKLPLSRSLPPLLLLSSFRVLGLFFLIPGVASGTIPKEFALPTAYGDATAAILALIAAVLVRSRLAPGIAVVWVYNVVGLLDLGNAFLQTHLHGLEPSHLAATWFLPAVNVPAILTAHLMMIILLLRKKGRLS